MVPNLKVKYVHGILINNLLSQFSMLESYLEGEDSSSRIVKIWKLRQEKEPVGVHAPIAQEILLRKDSCSPGFESSPAYHLCFYAQIL